MKKSVLRKVLAEREKTIEEVKEVVEKDPEAKEVKIKAVKPKKKGE